MTASLPLPESIWSRIPEDVREVLAVLLAAQRERTETLVGRLQARLGQDSSNSHKPPSAPPKKKPTGRKS